MVAAGRTSVPLGPKGLFSEEPLVEKQCTVTNGCMTKHVDTYSTS